MENKHIHTCHHCGQLYCAECTENQDWEIYCSEECETESKEEQHEESEEPRN